MQALIRIAAAIVAALGVTLDNTKAAEPTEKRCRPASVAKPGTIAVGWLPPADSEPQRCAFRMHFPLP